MGSSREEKSRNKQGWKDNNDKTDVSISNFFPLHESFSACFESLPLQNTQMCIHITAALACLLRRDSPLLCLDSTCAQIHWCLERKGYNWPLDGTVVWCIHLLSARSFFYVCFYHMALSHFLSSILLPPTLPSSFFPLLFFSMHSMYGSCTAGSWARNHRFRIDVRCLKTPGSLTKDSVWLPHALYCTYLTR